MESKESLERPVHIHRRFAERSQRSGSRRCRMAKKVPSRLSLTPWTRQRVRRGEKWLSKAADHPVFPVIAAFAVRRAVLPPRPVRIPPQGAPGWGRMNQRLQLMISGRSFRQPSRRTEFSTPSSLARASHYVGLLRSGPGEHRDSPQFRNGTIPQRHRSGHFTWNFELPLRSAASRISSRNIFLSPVRAYDRASCK